MSKIPSPASTQIRSTIGPPPRNASCISLLFRDVHGGPMRVQAPCPTSCYRLSTTYSHMSLRHRLAVALTGLVLIACGKQQPLPQASRADAPKASLDTASIGRADRARIQGSSSAPVWLVMSSDFQCPYCRMFHDDAYKRILSDYVATGKVRIAYWNQPSPMHVHAVVAAEAAMCAALQDKFWPMHDGLFATQDHWAGMPEPRPVFDSLANALHLQMDQWRSCTASHAT